MAQRMTDSTTRPARTLSDAAKLRLLAEWFDMWDSVRYDDRQRILDDEANPGKNDVQRDLRRIASAIEAEAAAPDAGLREALERLTNEAAELDDGVDEYFTEAITAARAALAAHPASAPDPDAETDIAAYARWRRDPNRINADGRVEAAAPDAGPTRTFADAIRDGWHAPDMCAAPDAGLRLAAERVIASFSWDEGPLPVITDSPLPFGNAVNRLRAALAAHPAPTSDAGLREATALAVRFANHGKSQPPNDPCESCEAAIEEVMLAIGEGADPWAPAPYDAAHPASAPDPTRYVRLDNLGPVCQGSCSIDSDDHYHAARLEDRSGAAPAGPAVDVDRLSDVDLEMLKAAIAKEQQRRYRLTHPDPAGDAE